MARHETTTTLIESAIRRAMLPVTNITFKEKDFLAFANEELDMALIPYVLSFHEDYFLTSADIPMTTGRSAYPIPYRAIGNKLRDVQIKDRSGNLYELTRTGVGDRPYFQHEGGGRLYSGLRSFDLESNNIVLSTDSTSTSRNILVNGVASGRIVSAPFHGLSTGQPLRFTAGTLPSVTVNSIVYVRFITSSSIALAVSEVAASSSNSNDWINIDGNVNATFSILNSDLTATGESIVAYYYLRPNKLVSETRAMIITSLNDLANGNIVVDKIPLTATSSTLFSSSSVVDFIQVKSPHKCLKIDVPLTGVDSVNKIISIDPANIPLDLAVGDHILLSEECIIPQIPTDLHSMLAQRIACRCLEALGDREGLAAANAKLQEMEAKGGTILDNRVDDAPKKINPRHGFLRLNVFGRWGK